MTSIVSYDLRTQVGMLKKLATFMAALRGGRDGADERKLHGGGGLHDGLKGAMRWGAGAVLLGVFAWLVLRALRTRRGDGTRPRSRHDAQVAGLYGELERALARRGHPRPAAVTPLEHARHLTAQGFPQHAEVDAVTGSYLEARYGDRVLTPAELAQLRAAIARVRRPAA
jgi:hypothetical protein